MIDESILRENDIRGIYGKNITEEIAFYVGLAFGTYFYNKGKNKVVVGYDNRVSGDKLVTYLMKGLLNSGMKVTFLGIVTTPILNYATIKLNIEAGIMVTASHNPSNENGFKLFGENFLHLRKDDLNNIYKLIKTKDFIKNTGNIVYYDIIDDYTRMLNTYNNIGTRKLRVAIDPGNGTTSIFIENIMKNINIDPVYINLESDGNFPNHNPDPNDEKNLQQLQKLVREKKCDFGVAYDGDGDRIGVVDECGKIIECDKLMAIFARDILPKTSNKKIIIDVKCSKALIEYIKNLKSEPIMVKNGSAYIETVLFDKNVLFGGEYSGHVFFRDKFYGFDDGIYASIRLIEILSNKNCECSELLTDYKHYFNTPEIKVLTTDEKKWKLVKKVEEYCIMKKYDYLNIDGVRVNYSDGWALVRCSNTGPNITMRFESTTEVRLEEIKKEFTDLVNSLK